MDRLEPFAVTIPAGNGSLATATTNLSFADGIVTNLHVTVPPGPAGLVGFRFLHAGAQLLPRAGTQFFIADSREIDWPLHGLPTAGRWQLQAYNADVFNHTLYFEFWIDEILTTVAPRYPDLVAIET